MWAAITVATVAGGALCSQAAGAGAAGWRELAAPGRFEELLVAGGGVVGLLALARLWLVATLTVLDVLRGRVPATLPRGLVRRGVLALCGAALTASVALPAHAAPVDSRGLAGLPYPDRASLAPAAPGAPHDPAEPAQPDRGRPAETPAPSRADRVTGPVTDPVTDPVADRVATTVAPGLHVVRPGDTLWGIAVSTLPPSASAAEVDARWRELHRANADTIGADPHLIRPGQELTLPRHRPTDTHQGDQS